MKFYSDITKRLYDSQSDLQKDELRIKSEQEKKAEAEKKKSEERAIRAKEVEAAYKAAVEASENYSKVLNQFLKDYGSYHMTVDNPRISIREILSPFFNLF